MARGGQAAVPVGRADRGDAGRRLAGGVDDDERDPARGQSGDLLGRELAHHQDEPRAATGSDGVDPAAPKCARAFLCRQHHAELVLARDLLDALDDLHRPRALEFVEDDVEQRRPRLSRGLRALVAVLVKHALDPIPGLRRHVRSSVDDFRNCRNGHTGRVGDMRDRHPSGHGAERIRYVSRMSRNFLSVDGASVVDPDGTPVLLARVRARRVDEHGELHHRLSSQRERDARGRRRRAGRRAGGALLRPSARRLLHTRGRASAGRPGDELRAPAGQPASLRGRRRAVRAASERFRAPRRGNPRVR